MEEKTVIILVIVMVSVCGIVGIWNYWFGHDLRAVYNSRALIHKFFGYPIWNLVAFFSFGILPHKS